MEGMSELPSTEVTRIFADLQAERISRARALDRVFELAYEELRRLAVGMMRSERPDHTLQPTALVHEAYRRLVDETQIEWQGRSHFFAIAARAMRRILVDHARRRSRTKRGGDWQRITLDERLQDLAVSPVEILELDDTLSRLAELDERMARVVEMRVFGGLTAEEVAHVLGVSRRTVQSDWRLAQAWFAREFEQ
jgi:RNA polymerase sigma factor (TIGR02999 family)